MKKILIISIISIITTFYYSITAIAQTNKVGTLPGNVSVSSSGAANYSIPIDLPAGRAGMTPELALVYNSQGDDGIMGKGWSISGWSYIGRAKETEYYNGYNGSIDFVDDQLVLDGSRLIETGQSSNSIEYRTEIDGILKIEKQLSKKKEKDLSSFIVKTKSGITKEYGSTENSRQVYKSTENPAIRYHLTKIQDIKGNYIKYKYLHDIIYENGEMYLDEISYTHNINNSSEKTYSVKFEYEDILDEFFKTSFFTNIHVNDEYHYRVAKHLKSITIEYDNQIIKKYIIEYENGGILNKPYVTSIQFESNNSDIKLNETIFEWTYNEAAENNYSIEFEGAWQESFTPEIEYAKGDFNGDGIADIVETGIFSQEIKNNEGTYIRLGKDPNSQNIFVSNTIADKMFTMDINGDGKDELFIQDETDNDEKILLYTFNIENDAIIPELIGEINGEIITFGDFDGNGLNDCIYKYYNDYFLKFGNNTINTFWSNQKIINNYSILSNYRTGDFIGDGKTDFVNINLDGDFCTTVYYIEKIDNSTYKLETSFTQFNIFNQNEQLLAFDIGDFNGDTKHDILLSKINTGGNETTQIYYSFGEGFMFNGFSGTCTYYYDNYTIADLNNDGIDDIFKYSFRRESPYDNYYTLRFSKYFKYPNISEGFEIFSGTHIHNLSSVVGSNYSHIDFLIADFSGNGEKDLFYSYIYTELIPPSTSDNITEFHKTKRITNIISDEILGDDIIISATNGFGVKQNIYYKRFSPYTYTPTTYPIMRYKGPLFVVNKTNTDNNAGGHFPSIEYSYTGAQIHATGKGFIGFQQTSITNFQTNTSSLTNFTIFENDNKYYHPYPDTIRQYSLIEGTDNTDKLLMETINTLEIKKTVSDNNIIYLPVITESVTQAWDNNPENTFIKTVKTIQNLEDIDMYGNSLLKTVLTDPEQFPINNENYDFITTIQNSYLYDEDNWLIGRPLSSTITNIYVDDLNNDVKKIDFTYYSVGEFGSNEIVAWPFLKNKKITPNESIEYSTEISYDAYDIYGNILKKTLKAPGANPAIADRVTEYEYKTDNDYNGRFLTKKFKSIDGVEHANTYEYNVVTGNLIKETNAAGLITTYEYDEFGKPWRTFYPDGTSSTVVFDWSVGHPDEPPSLAMPTFFVYKNNYSTGPNALPFEKSYTFYDIFERDIRQVSYGLNNEKIYIDKEYNNKGQLWKISESYFSNEIPQKWTVFDYDILGRKTKITTPTNSQDIEYNGRTIKTTNNETEVTVDKTINAIGNPILVNDPTGEVTYEYYSSGNVKSINAIGSTTTMEYDLAGNQNKLTDPNAGIILYTYNPFGELIEQTDARNNKYTMEYDVFGRLSSKTLTNNNETTTYTYKNEGTGTAFGFGKLQTIAGANGITYSYEYDELNRLSSEIETIDGYDFLSSYQYNLSDGKLNKYIYPTGFEITYQYSQNGMIQSVNDVINKNTLWQANEMNARGQLTEYALGNGITTEKAYDEFGFPQSIISDGGLIQNLAYSFNSSTGNLSGRTDYNSMYYESFEYDELLKSRLTRWQIYGLNDYSIDYDYNGNIISKSDVTQNSGELIGEYNYGVNAGPHAVTSITNPTTEYLNNANQQNITYTAFNKVKEISKPNEYSEAPHTDNLLFTYGPDNKRKKTEFFVNGVLSKTKYFIGSNFEVIIGSDGNQRKLHYLNGGDGTFAILENPETDNIIYYIHKDYLGSYETITNRAGNLVEKLSFDPWGRRRNPISKSFEMPQDYLFDRGYTGHEHLDEFGLINMNGRVYDPFLARFLSPDPFVQAPGYGQNYNRYSYAFNNPLKFTDPSGECGFLIFLGVSAIMGGTFFGMQPDGSFDWGEAAKGALIGTAVPIGMLGAALSPYAPVIAGVYGALGSAAIAGIAMYGSDILTTGAISLATNGSFTPDFKSAGINAGITALFAGMSGGIRAKNSGRNFWTGAKINSSLNYGQINIPNYSPGDPGMSYGGPDEPPITYGPYGLNEVEVFGKYIGKDITVINKIIRIRFKEHYKSIDHSFKASLSRFFYAGKQLSRKNQSGPHPYNGFYKGLGQGGGSGYIPHESFFHLNDYLNHFYNFVPDTSYSISVDEWLWRYTHPFTNNNKYPGIGNW